MDTFDDEVRSTASEDEDDHVEATPAPTDLCQSKILDNWIYEKATTDGFKKDTKNTSPIDALSLKGLIAKQESAPIINTPRDYQIELFERAKNENLVAVLDTGLGKTLIAVLLLRHMLDQEAEDRAAGKPERVAFFLVPSVQLVLQQAAVLSNNLSYPIGSLYGAMRVDLWSKADWATALGEHRVIVCTAAILQNCLDKAFIDISQINLMIFDEAHHTKKKHPYALIVKEHYLAQPDLLKRPRILGMTASPVDAKINIAGAASKLETLLDSKIVSTGELSSFQAKSRPQEKTTYYSSHASKWDTAMARDLSTRLGDLPYLQSLYDQAMQIADHLGGWCADQAMLHALSERSRYKLEAAVEKNFRGRSSGTHDVARLDASRAKYAEMLNYLDNTYSSQQTMPDMSNKVAVLRNILEAEVTTNTRCLVFVERRSTAQLLCTLFNSLNIHMLRSGYIVGHGTTNNLLEQQDSFREQIVTMSQFRQGDINCLFATNVAEEGLDVPACNLVVRFDLYKSMIQYIQSRGRARQANSLFVHMIDNQSPAEQEMYQGVRIAEVRMRDWCNTLPDDRRLLSDETILQQINARDVDQEVYIDSETGAKLSYGNALGCLEHYVATLPDREDEHVHTLYLPVFIGGGFCYEVILPDGAASRSAKGKPCSRKMMARQAAAFRMCRKLHRQGALDHHFLPTDRRKAHAMRNAILAVSTKATKHYDMLVKPAIWKMPGVTQRLWLTKIDFAGGFERNHRPLYMLTRHAMPVFPSFSIVRNDGKETMVESKVSDLSIDFNEEEIQLLGDFTFKVFEDVFSKKYEVDIEKLSYFLAPASAIACDHFSKHAIDWELICQCTLLPQKWARGMQPGEMLGTFLIDPSDGSRKLVAHSIHPTLRQTDDVPEDAAKYKHNKNILDYSVSLWRSSRAKADWTPDQPVLVAEVIVLRRNMLVKATEKVPPPSTKAYVCPEPFRISRLPMSVVTSCLAWPSIIWRFDSVLLSMEVCKGLGIDCAPALALAAITKTTDDLKDGGITTVHHGMGENYERLEFFGDCYLKLATTLAVFTRRPTDNQELSHINRMLMLCNKNLLNVSSKLGLAKYIRSKGFNRRLWYPEGLNLLEGKGHKSGDHVYHEEKHSLGDKSVADVSEALIGAALVSHNSPGDWHADDWREAVLAVTKLVHESTQEAKLHDMQKWEDYFAAYQIPEYQTRMPNAAQKDMALLIEKVHDYHFKSPTLLRSAFVHPSCPNKEDLPNYERLEFLGDALLDMAVITHLFYRYPHSDESWMTEAKTLMAGNKFYSALAVRLGFHRHIRHSYSDMGSQINAYCEDLSAAQHQYGIDYWSRVKIDAPKCLADLVESYVGAMFIDSGFDYGVVQHFFDVHVLPFFQDMKMYAGQVKDAPSTRATHLLQSFGCRAFKLMSRDLPQSELSMKKELVSVLMVHNEVVAHSTGTSVRYSGDRAAGEAYHLLQKLSVEDFREKYGCNCASK